MSNLKKIKIFKRQKAGFTILEGAASKPFESVSERKKARELAARVNEWVVDYRARKRESEFKEIANFSAKGS